MIVSVSLVSVSVSSTLIPPPVASIVSVSISVSVPIAFSVSISISLTIPVSVSLSAARFSLHISAKHVASEFVPGVEIFGAAGGPSFSATSVASVAFFVRITRSARR